MEEKDTANPIFVARDLQNVLSDVAWESITSWFPEPGVKYSARPFTHLAVWGFWGVIGVIVARCLPIGYCSTPLIVVILAVFIPNAVRILRSDMNVARKGMLVAVSVGYAIETVLYFFPSLGGGLGFDYDSRFDPGLME